VGVAVHPECLQLLLPVDRDFFYDPFVNQQVLVLLQRKKLPLDGPLVISLPRELLNLVGIIGHYNILADSHGKADEADDREHVVVVVEEP